jgi:hypothetical protein
MLFLLRRRAELIKKIRFVDGVNHMGFNLKKWYGGDLKMFGFCFNQTLFCDIRK